MTSSKNCDDSEWYWPLQFKDDINNAEAPAVAWPNWRKAAAKQCKAVCREQADGVSPLFYDSSHAAERGR
ncbi:MAG: hypothetical protein ACR2N1_13940 [Rubripirellula sp.]